MLGRYLLSALSFVLALGAGVVVAQDGSSSGTNLFVGQQVGTTPYSVIFYDYTSKVQYGLPGHSPEADLDTTYDTTKTKSFRFGVDWAGDADSVTINPAVTTAARAAAFLVVNENPSNPLCDPASNGGVFSITLNQQNAQCNYTVSWQSPFAGQLAVTYDNSTMASETIQVLFTAPTITGDPQFVGLRGQQYQVHGIDGAVYNIITEQNTQVNSRFVFLTEGECPMINGVADSNCWSHPGSYLGEMSFQQVVDGKLHAALVTAGDAKKGFAMVQVDGKRLAVGDKVSFGSFSVEMKSAYSVIVNTDHYEFDLSNSDMFINQALRSKVALSKLQSHGLLGQTHASKTHSSSLRYIEGEVDDYVIADNDIFGDDFVYNQFQQ